MAADGMVNLEAENACCKAWKAEYLKFKKRRDALKEAVQLFEKENAKLHKEFDEERARIEKDRKDEEAARIALQNEISSLKAENLSLLQKVDSVAGEDSKVNLLEARVSQGVTEIKHLKEAHKKEKARADSEKKKAQSEKKRASEVQKMLQDEKNKAAAERKTTSVELQKAEVYKLQLNELKKEADKVRSKCEEMNKKLEMEKQRANKEKQHTDTEKAKAQEQRKLAAASERKLREEKSRGDTLYREVEQGKEMIEKLRKEIHELKSSILMSKGPYGGGNRALHVDAANKKDYNFTDILKGRADKSTMHMVAESALKGLEIQKQNLASEKKLADSEMMSIDEQRRLMLKYKKKTLKEKRHADQLLEELTVERERSKEFQLKLCEHGSRKPIEGLTGPYLNDTINESAKLKFLKKQLKHEKMKAKHAKEVAELERQRCNMMLQELHCMKLEFGQFSNRLSLLDNYFSLNYAGMEEVEKNGNRALDKWKRHLGGLQSLQKYFQTENELVKFGCASVTPDTEMWHPTCRGSSTDFISGIDSKLERLPGRSNRKKLKRSGINSALASFSDRELVGSQDMGDLTVNKPAELVRSHLNEQTIASSHLDGYNNLMGSEKFPVVAENSIRSTHVNGDVVDMKGKKRKRLIDVVESVDHMCLESRKLHLQIEKQLSGMHDMLMKQREEPLVDGGYFTDDDSPTKIHACQKRTLLSKQKIGGEDSCQDYERKDDDNLVIEVCRSTDFSGQSSDLQVEVNREEFRDSFESDIMASPMIVDGEYMKLLDLDDPVDEQRYRTAIERPLSPTLPEIDVEGVEAVHLNIEKGLQRIPRDKENPSSSKDLDASNWKNVDSRLLGFAFSESNESMLSCGNKVQAVSDIMPKYCVVPSDNRDVEGLSKIVSAIKRCMNRSSLMTDSVWALKKILNELKIEEKLLAKEKACVLFSLLLQKFSSTGSGTLGFPLDRDSIGCIDAFAGHIRAEIDDVETRALLAESFFSREVISLIDDFLVEGKLLVCSETTSEDSTVGERSVYIDVEGIHVFLISVAAPTNILAAGAVVLSTMCASIDQNDFIFEASYRVGHARGCDSSQKLAVLHVFAHISGRSYFTLNSYSLLITVLKSLVFFLEGANSHCIQCPFSSQAVPVEVALTLVLEELENAALSGKVDTEVNQPIGDANKNIPASMGVVEESTSGKGIQVVLDGHSNVSGAESNKNSWNLGSGLPSLVELMAVNLGWEWTKIKIMPQLLKILESCVEERSAIAIIVLIGQLGRLGVEASGYDDTAVESLRCHMCGFLCQASTSKLGFPIQTAIATALLHLLPLDLDSVLLGTGNLPSSSSQCILARAIAKWFSSLSKEQQSSVHSLLHSAATP